MSYRPATKTAGTLIRLRRTRSWRAAARARCMYHCTGVVRNSRAARSTTDGLGVRHHEAAVPEQGGRARPDRQPGGHRGDRPAGAGERGRHPDAQRPTRPAGDLQRSAHRGERAAGHARDREQAGHPLGVLDGELEGGVHADRPADHRAGVDLGVVEHREGVLDERGHVDPVPVRRPVGAADAAVVPRDAPARRSPSGSSAGHAYGLVPKPVAQQHRRAVGVVGPGPQPGAVGAGDVVEAQRLVPAGDRERTRRGGRRACGQCARAAWSVRGAGSGGSSRDAAGPGSGRRARRGTPRRRAARGDAAVSAVLATRALRRACCWLVRCHWAAALTRRQGVRCICWSVMGDSRKLAGRGRLGCR